MDFQKFNEDSTKNRKISVSKMPLIPDRRIARINSLKFSGNYYESPNRQFWIAYCDTYTLKKNPCYFGQGNQILLYGEGLNPEEGKVANNGTFAINDKDKKERGSTFYVFDRKGRILIKHKLEGFFIFAENGISEDGDFAICLYGNTLYFFDLNSRSLKWSLIPECNPQGCYLFDCKKKYLYLQSRNGQSYRYDFDGNFLDVEKWQKDKIAYATPYELYDIAAKHLTEGDTPLSSDKMDEVLSLLNRALTSPKIDIEPDFKANIYVKIGDLYKRQNHIDQAIENYKWALRLADENIAFIYRKVGEAHEKQYEIEDAIQNYEMALENNSKAGVKRKLEKLKEQQQKIAEMYY